MSQIDSIDAAGWEQLAMELFDDVMVPLANEKQARDAQAYFALQGDADADTYFVEPSLRSMQAADFQPHRGDAQGLVAAVTAMWADQGETELAELGERMTKIAELLAAEPPPSDGTVDVLCYTLF